MAAANGLDTLLSSRLAPKERERGAEVAVVGLFEWREGEWKEAEKDGSKRGG